MKTLYVNKIKTLDKGTDVEIWGWISTFTKHKELYFVKVEDSTGSIDVVLQLSTLNFKIKRDQSVHIFGKVGLDKNENVVVDADSIELVGDVNVDLSPSARSDIDVFAERNANNVVLNKHLYIRNKKFCAVLKARDLVIEAVRAWFKTNGYTDVTAPILTPILLYDKSTGIPVKIKNQDAFLTQCVGFYLESAVHSLEKVYNIGPSFRGAESISKRHLMEYWHIKSETAFCSFDEYFDVVEDLVSFATKYVKEHGGPELAKDIGTEFCDDGMKAPFPRITYTKAIELLNENGINLAYGKSLNDISEKFLSDYFGGPIWITHKPKCIEGFPYREIEKGSDLTMTADLIASHGLGEILGIAEKITNIDEIKERLLEKGKSYDEYKWFCDLREYGTVPHCGLGMGLERLIRWMFKMNHVKDVIPFPRRINKVIYP
ncbi:MAG: hypothetical protein IJX17_04435 [Clostridia bacterium]|nr:hypothetical protein [Clostridia bacterium]